MNVRIITDSTADYPECLRSRLTVVPLTVHFGDEEYIDGVNITHDTFYNRLISGDVLPTTSQATPERFFQCFREVARAGDTAVVITISSSLSGTCQSAAIAASEFPGTVFVVDSANVSIGAGVLVSLAVRLADQGLSAADIAARLEEEKKKVRVMAVLDTLEYLKRGGRISKTAAFAGGILSIKPMLAIRDGVIQATGKARGVRQGMAMLRKAIEDAGGVDFDLPACLGYTGISDESLQNFRRDCGEDPIAALPHADIGCVVGTHAGPGAYGLAFFVK